MSHAATVPLNRRLADRIGDLLSRIAWNGLFQVDYIERADRYVLIDLNPRIYTSLGIAIAAGVNLPAIWVDLLRGEDVPTRCPYAIGIGYRHDEDDMRALLAMLVRGPRRAALKGLIPRRGTVHAVFSWDDPAPILTSLGKLGRVVRGWVPRTR